MACKCPEMFYLVFFFLCLVPSSNLKSVSSGKDTLVLLHVLFRHGNRTPDPGTQYPTDPHLNHTFEPFGLGQLTIKGKKTEYAIGEYLRLAYDGFLPDQYIPDLVYATTTNFKRTKMSLQLVLASLFPPLVTDEFANGLKWQPIPFNIDVLNEVLGLPLLYCTNYVKEYYNYLDSEEGQKTKSNYTDLFKVLTKYTGRRVQSLKNIFDLYTVLASERDCGLKLPDWTTDLFPSKMEVPAGVYFETLAANAVLKKFSAGFLLKKILEDSLDARSKTVVDTKLFLYSGHDYNVGAVLKTLGVFDGHVPPYGAMILFEIHNVGGIYGLKLYYQDYKNTTPKLLTIPGCSSFCELDKVYSILEDFLPGENDSCSATKER